MSSKNTEVDVIMWGYLKSNNLPLKFRFHNERSGVVLNEEVVDLQNFGCKLFNGLFYKAIVLCPKCRFELFAIYDDELYNNRTEKFEKYGEMYHCRCNEEGY